MEIEWINKINYKFELKNNFIIFKFLDMYYKKLIPIQRLNILYIKIYKVYN